AVPEQSARRRPRRDGAKRHGLHLRRHTLRAGIADPACSLPGSARRTFADGRSQVHLLPRVPITHVRFVRDLRDAMKTPQLTRRHALLTMLFGSGYIGLRAMATGLPAWFLLNPRRATAGDLTCAINAKENLQYLI